METATELGAMLAAHGIVTDVLDTFGADLGDLSAYQCVWDLQVDFPLSAVVESRFRDQVVRGGSLYLAGEHAVFAPRNDTVAELFNRLGAGPVFPSPFGTPAAAPQDLVEPTNPAHPLAFECNAVTEIVYDGVLNGQLIQFGTGEWITGGPTTGACTIAFERGTMPLAPDARAVAALDINYLATGPAGTLDFRVLDRTVPTQNRAYAENLVGWLCVRDFDCGGGQCRPRNHGYWHRTCLGTDAIDPGRRGRGEGPPPSRDLADLPADLLPRVDAALAPHGLDACQALDEGSFSDLRLAALRELATLHFNLVAGWLDRQCPVELHPVVDDPGLTVGDAVRLVEERLADGSDEALREARWIGEHVVNGEAL